MYALTLLFLTITASPEPYGPPLSDPPTEEEQRPCEEVQNAQEDVESFICWIKKIIKVFALIWNGNNLL